MNDEKQVLSYGDIRSMMNGERRQSVKHNEGNYQFLVELNADVIDSAPVCIMVSNTQHFVQIWNPCLEQLTSIKSDTIIGQCFVDLLPTPKRSKIVEIYDDVIKTGNPQVFENIETNRFFGSCPEEKLWINVKINPLKRNDIIVGSTTYIEDITERTQAIAKKDKCETLLFEAQQKVMQIRNVFTFFHHPIFIISPTGNYLDANWSGLKMFGFQSREEFVESTIFDFLPTHQPDGRLSREIVTKKIEETTNIGHSNFELQHILDDKSIIFVEVYACEIIYNKEIAIHAIVMDITEQRKNEEALRSSEEKLKMALEVSKTYLWEFDTNTGKGYAHPEIYNMLGYDRDLLAKSFDIWLELIHPNDREKVIKNFVHQIRQTGRFFLEYRIKTKDGSWKWFQAAGKVVSRNKKGDPLRIIGTNADITPRKMMEEELRKAKEIAEAANTAKTIFLTNMSHELRTPLNAILGFSTMIARDPTLSSEHLNELSIINRSGEHLLNVINDVLDMSQIEAGRLSLDNEHFNLYYFMQSLNEMFAIRARNKGLQFNMDFVSGIPKYVYGDSGKLRQILINLVNNAIKSTEMGCITVRIALLDSTPVHMVETSETKDYNGQKKLVFDVEDTGIGIPEEKIHTIFEPFSRTSDTHGSSEGTGLGLSISRNYVRLMGGDISVTSESGKGSTFRFTINVRISDESSIEEIQQHQHISHISPGQPDYKILIIEDNQDNRLLLKKLLQSVGFITQEATHGLEGMQIFQEWKPDLVFLDMRMPVMDGYEFVQEIKKTQQGKNTPVIAITSSAFEEQRQHIIAVGCNDFISKPFQESDVFMALTKHLDVSFVYTDKPDGQKHDYYSLDEVFSQHHLLEIPDQIRADLVTAIQALDMNNIELAIIKIRDYNSILAETILHYVDNYRYDDIIKKLTIDE